MDFARRAPLGLLVVLVGLTALVAPAGPAFPAEAAKPIVVNVLNTDQASPGATLRVKVKLTNRTSKRIPGLGYVMTLTRFDRQLPKSARARGTFNLKAVSPGRSTTRTVEPLLSDKLALGGGYRIKVCVAPSSSRMPQPKPRCANSAVFEIVDPFSDSTIDALALKAALGSSRTVPIKLTIRDGTSATGPIRSSIEPSERTEFVVDDGSCGDFFTLACDMSVTFVPATVGEVKATLVITLPTGAVKRIALLGLGTAE